MSSNSTISNKPKQIPFILQFTAGGVAGISEILTMYPLDVIKTRLQLVQTPSASTVQSSSITRALRQIVKTEGVGHLYRGILSPLLIEAPKRATKFAANEFYSQYWMKVFNRSRMNQPLSVLTGVSAGMTEAFLVVSFELVKIRMQDKRYAGKYRNMADCIRKIAAEEGFITFAKGLEPTLWRHAMWNGGYFGVIHFVRSAIAKPSSLHKKNSVEGPSFPESQLGYLRFKCKQSYECLLANALFRDFICGAIGGTVGTMLNTPFDVVKTRIQGHIGSHPLYRWAIPSLFRIWREEGAAALFKGFKPKVIRLGPGGGILLVVYDRMIKFFESLYE